MTYDKIRYYELAAQVLPVLVLVLAIELRMFGMRVNPDVKRKTWHAVTGFVFLVILGTGMALGEVAALQVVYTGRIPPSAAGYVRTALVTSSVLIGAILLAQLLPIVGDVSRRARVIAYVLAAAFILIQAWTAAAVLL